MTSTDEQPRPLPPGEITWDGTTIAAGGIALDPGEYRIGPAVLVVAPYVCDEEDLAGYDE